jgi:hypothetical protein
VFLKKFKFSDWRFFWFATGVDDTSAVVHLMLQMSPKICEKIWNGPNGILWGCGETDSWKEPEAKNLVTLSLQGLCRLHCLLCGGGSRQGAGSQEDLQVSANWRDLGHWPLNIEKGKFNYCYWGWTFFCGVGHLKAGENFFIFICSHRSEILFKAHIFTVQISYRLRLM